MTRASQFAVVLVTAPDLRVARRLARAALEARLAACANLVPRIESHYWWREAIERATEILILLKTTRARLAALERLILANHPYDTPEFIVVPLVGGSARYLDWVSMVARPRGQRVRRGDKNSILNRAPSGVD
jgi:periplasmic divalent cation tolerance protein